MMASASDHAASAALAFETAARAAGEVREHAFRLAGRNVRMRFAGTALQPLLTEAFRHLPAADEADVDLTICCWDDATTGITTPEPPISGDGTGIDFVPGPVSMAWEPGHGNLAVYDAVRRTAFQRYRAAASLPSWERAGPLRRVLHWWAADRSLQLVHAAAIGTLRGGVLLVGRGGSGKSTTALAAIGSELQYAADDYCLLSCEREPTVHSLYDTGKADPASVARLPRLRAAFAASSTHGEGKTVIFVSPEFASSQIISFPLRAIVLPRLGEDRCRLDRISASVALRAVAPSTMFQLPGHQVQTLARLAAVVRRLPCWTLALGPDPAAAIPLIAQAAEGRS
jgi:hypothetical protein